MSEWIEHVKKYQQQHGTTYKEALQGAKATYKKSGGSVKSAFIRHIIHKDNFDVKKMTNPSKNAKEICKKHMSNFFDKYTDNKNTPKNNKKINTKKRKVVEY